MGSQQNGDAGLTRTTSRGVMVLPRVVEDLGKQQPDRTWVSIPKSADLKHGWRDITYRELVDAVNGMARWVERELGPSESQETVAYLGLNDTRYAVVATGLIKNGYKVLLPSPRNSQDGQASLFQTTACRTILHSEGVGASIENIEAGTSGLKKLEVPSFDELQRVGSEAEPYEGHHSEAEDDQILVLHTSGSTGLPKPIYITNGALATLGTLGLMPAPQGHRNAHDALLNSGEPLLVMSPFFHTMGMIALIRSIFCKGPLVLLPPERPANAQLVLEVLEQRKPWAGIFAPSILEQISGSPEGLEELGRLTYVFYGGAPLAHDVGEKINEKTNVVPMIGSTEAGLIANQLPADKRDWEYFEWALGSGVDMEPDGEGLYEMVIKRKGGKEERRYQGVFHVFPEIKEWRTKDLYEQHPSKPNLWLYKGRKDDVLVLNNGEKFNPVGFEKTVESDSLVQGAIVVGQSRFQTGLIIEPEWEKLPKDLSAEDFLDQIWPVVERANAGSPAHGRVWRSKIAISKRDKPFKRAPKGSIMRRATVDAYHSEIEALYSNEASNEQLGTLDSDADLPTTKSFLRQAVKLTGLTFPDDASDDADIFSYGADSLQVLALSSTLSHAVGKDRSQTISPRIIYAHPTINRLAAHLQGGSANGTAAEKEVSRGDAMAAMVEKYTHDLPPAALLPRPAARPSKHTVILTGSTGSLGNYILEELIASPRVAKVICMNRSANAADRQRQSFQSRGLEPNFNSVTFLHTDFSQSRFGLPQPIYADLLERADVFIHNAWAVDFNHSLDSFEPVHIAGTRRAVGFSLASAHRAHILFVSSIASVGNWFASHSPEHFVPETLLEDNTLPVPQGYGESKHVAALILAKAASRSDVPSTIARAGQLAGPTRVEGMEWNRHEWLPSIVISSKAMGMLPETLGNQDVVDWVPLDLAAKTVWDVVESRTSKGHGGVCEVAHVVNPQTVSWKALVPGIAEFLTKETGREVKVVPFKLWLDELRAVSTTDKAEVERKPAVKLVDFYAGLDMEGGGLPRLATEETAGMSETTREMEPVDGGLMAIWLRQWAESEPKK